MALQPEIEIVAIQSVPPFKITEPRKKVQVLVKDPVGWEVFQGSLNIILYYKQAREEESGWMMAGWIKESLSRAFLEEPLLSGRLRRGEDGLSELEIVANDSGARLVEAKASITLEEFLGLEYREKVEAKVVFWKEFDEQNPQFSPLFYVQVTNFKCGGYSIGISCSLLLADLLVKGTFLQRWAEIQGRIISKNGEVPFPIFYLPNLKANGSSPTSAFWSTPVKSCGQTMVFKIPYKQFKDEQLKAIALISVEEAQDQLGNYFPSNTFPMLVKDSNAKVIKANICEKDATNLVRSEMVSLRPQVTASSWDDFGIHKVAFLGGNEPVTVSYWIGSDSANGLVMAIPSREETVCDLNFIVCIPQGVGN